MKYNFTNKVPELLAPAGSFACLKAAVQNGADAVYLGLKTGSARMGAENFTLGELEEAVRYAHIRGVRVYLALNTILFENELDTAYDTAKAAVRIGVDALILQDLGLAAKICRNRQEFPCELHASTQMSIYNEAGLKFLKQMGFNRCITARELSVAELSRLCEIQIMDVEVFCHGALCMSLSGQCLLSSFIGGRSGNRGTCAQPCRKKYALDSGRVCTPYAYRLSPSDFAALPHIRALIQAGVHSLKIEGRLKSPAYVAIATRYYRQAIDDLHSDISGKMRDLQLLFGRGDFTSGYLFGKIPFRDITFRSAGRLGVPVGTVKKFPVRLPVPKTMPRNLMRFRFTVQFNSPETVMKTGAGITIYDAGTEERNVVGGGTVNAVQYGQDPRCTEITVAGTLAAPGIGPYILSVTDDAQLRAMAEDSLLGENKKIPISMKFQAHVGEKPALELEDALGNKCISIAAAPVAQAVKAPVSEDEIRKQLSKLGDTPYVAENIVIDAERGLFLPVSVLNTLRRDCAAQLSELRAKRRPVPMLEPFLPTREARPMAGGISLFFYHFERFLSFQECALPEVLRPYRNELRTYYIPLKAFYTESASGFAQLKSKLTQLRSSCNCKIIAYFPYVSLGEALVNVKKELPGILDHFIGTFLDGFLCENPGDLALLCELLAVRADPKPLICCDYSFNAANCCALRLLGRSGVNRAALSPETAPDCIAGAASVVNPEVVVGGRIILMRSRHCYIDEGECCGKKWKCMRGKYALKDEYGCKFPILPQKEDCCSILLSHKPVVFSAAQVEKIRSACPEATLRVNVE